MDEEKEKQWSGKTSQDTAPPQWTPVSRSDLEGGSVGAGTWGKSAESSESGDEAPNTGIASVQQPSETVSSALRNPFGAMQQNAQGKLFLLLLLLYIEIFKGLIGPDSQIFFLKCLRLLISFFWGGEARERASLLVFY